MNESLLQEMEQLIQKKYNNTASIIVQKDGQKVYDYYLNDCTPHSPVHIFSVTKSILSILIGIAIDKGYIQSIDQKILDFFPDYTLKKREKTLPQITLRDMLTMTAPYKYKFTPYTKFFGSEDWVKSSLDLLGGKGQIGDFRYAPVIGPDIFSGILVQATGQSVLDFANEYLFGPLDITVKNNIFFETKEDQLAFYKDKTAEGWVVDPKGIHTGGWGLTLKPTDMLKIGELYLNDGIWNDKQIVSKHWIDQSTSHHSTWDDLLYGYLWWIIDEKEQAFAAMGDGGNVIYVNKKHHMVVVIAAYFKPRAEDRIKLIKEYIEPLFI